MVDSFSICSLVIKELCLTNNNTYKLGGAREKITTFQTESKYGGSCRGGGGKALNNIVLLFATHNVNMTDSCLDQSEGNL